MNYDFCWFSRYVKLSCSCQISTFPRTHVMCIQPIREQEFCMKSNNKSYLGPAKRICVFEHSVMTNFNCACPAIQRGQGSGFLSEGSSWLTACMSEQRRFWRDCADAQARLNLRCSHRRSVTNLLGAAHLAIFSYSQFERTSLLLKNNFWLAKECS